MAFENLFIRTQKSLAGIQFDATINEIHNSEVTVTKNPVELGADITDHSIIQPKLLEINVDVSDSPVGVAALGVIIDNVTGLFGTATSENRTRSSSAYNALIQLQEQREPLDVQTGLKLYSDMVVTNVSVTQDKDSSRIAAMRIQMQEVLIVESKVIELTPEQLQLGGTRQQGSSPVSGGRRENNIPTTETQSSVLKSVIDWIGG